MSNPAPAVTVRMEAVTLPTYEPQAPDRHPMFLEKRVYQGSSGRVYPLPFCDRIAEAPTPRAWQAIFLENEFLVVMILPELGGRIHRLIDKTNGYDALYHQPVIKPALVGLAGPWASGGIEFNWPQHHRPATFMPVETETERGEDGSITVWCSDHDPMARMKGMHGVCLRPGRAVLELRVRVYNRTPLPQTFLWWANVATRVHEHYQSFFPPDVTHVADHAKRATSTYPLCTGRYYGVDYGARARQGVPAGQQPRLYSPLPESAPNDLSWYANIPVPTSYMCVGSKKDFFGGYDHAAQAGLMHVANHHIAPGKKQWTWGNHEFGYAWDRNLTDADAHGEFPPYIEIMAGVYTDNQPDFSFLAPGETKTWTQVWYPFRAIGPACEANAEAALSLAFASGQARRARGAARAADSGATVRIGVAVTSPQPGACVEISVAGKTLATLARELSPAAPLVETIALPRGMRREALTITLRAADRRVLLVHTPVGRQEPGAAELAELTATEPPLPRDVASVDELYLTGVHLEQYRHATRDPAPYWREGLRRDGGDCRCHNALGRWHYRRGEFSPAEQHLRAAIRRLTQRNPNPEDGEPFYHLGLTLRQLGREDDAYAAFYKACWNQAWQSAGYHALAEIDCARRDWAAALDHLERSLRLNADNLRARALQVLVLQRVGRTAEARALLESTRALDPLDAWARHLAGEPGAGDAQTRLDIAHDLSRAGFFAEAEEVLANFRADDVRSAGAAPLIHYTAAWLAQRAGDAVGQRRALARARAAAPDYCFPARLEEIAVLESALAADPRDARAAYYLGNLLYDRRRHREAIALWERAVRHEPANAIAWRNLGIGYCNILRAPARARAAYARARRANPADARLLFESDQLAKRLGEPVARRWRALRRQRSLVAERDDLTVEFCALLNQLGRPAEALAILRARKFQPWEGGEGQVLAQHVRAHVALGRAALGRAEAAEARGHFETALTAPENLGEARHLLANQSDVRYWLGCACAEGGDAMAARRHWTTAATFEGDFQAMSVRPFSEMTLYSALAWARLGRRAQARALLRKLRAHARRLRATPAKIDYFATSLPTMLLFEDDLAARQAITADFLEAQALLGLGERAAARARLKSILRRDPAHALAADMLADAGSLRVD